MTEHDRFIYAASAFLGKMECDPDILTGTELKDSPEYIEFLAAGRAYGEVADYANFPRAEEARRQLRDEWLRGGP